MAHTHSKNKEQIVNAAVALFKRKGYYDVSINEICKDAGIGRSSFYAVFQGKQEIIRFLLAAKTRDLNSVFQDFIGAKNDFERMWCLCERDLDLAEELGPTLTSAILSMELNESLGIYGEMDAVNNWLVPLAHNAQAAGIIRCTHPAETMVPIDSDLMLQVIFNWCRCKGSFHLRERARFYAETAFDVAPEFRIT